MDDDQLHRATWTGVMIPLTVESHLNQSSHLTAAMSDDLLAIRLPRGDATKIRAANAHGVPLVAGGASFEIAAQRHTGLSEPAYRLPGVSSASRRY